LDLDSEKPVASPLNQVFFVGDAGYFNFGKKRKVRKVR
jgi:hypothetical protein